MIQRCKSVENGLRLRKEMPLIELLILWMKLLKQREGLWRILEIGLDLKV